MVSVVCLLISSLIETGLLVFVFWLFKAFTNSSALAYSEPDSPKAAKHLPKAELEQFSNALVLFIKDAFLNSSAVPTE